MISPDNFEKTFIKIIDKYKERKTKGVIKDDNSLVTQIDLNVEKALIKFLNVNFPDIYIISEENPQSHSKEYNLGKKFAIIDPIDGTENFYFFKNIYGSAISVVYNSFVYHGIYIPENKIIVSSLNINKFKSKKSLITLLSTSCLSVKQKKINNSYQNYRILGSSSYMFYLLLSGKANSYIYCGRAKVWDYYTGICLALMSKKFEIFIDEVPSKIEKIFNNKIKHKLSFKIYNCEK